MAITRRHEACPRATRRAGKDPWSLRVSAPTEFILLNPRNRTSASAILFSVGGRLHLWLGRFQNTQASGTVKNGREHVSFSEQVSGEATSSMAWLDTIDI